MRRRDSFLVVFALVACAHGRARVPADATRTVLSLRGIDCESCGSRVIEAARARDGVYAAEFDRRSAEVSIRHDAARVSASDLLALARAQDVDAVIGPGQGRYVAGATYPAGADVRLIARAGEDVELEQHVAAGKVTVFDFYAPWCQPCRSVDAHLVALVGERTDVAVRRLDVADWDSPLALRYLAEVSNLPFVLVYGKDGKRTAVIVGLDLAALDRAIAEAAK